MLNGGNVVLHTAVMGKLGQLCGGAPDSWLKGHSFGAQREQWENVLYQDQLS